MISQLRLLSEFFRYTLFSLSGSSIKLLSKTVSKNPKKLLFFVLLIFFLRNRKYHRLKRIIKKLKSTINFIKFLCVSNNFRKIEDTTNIEECRKVKIETSSKKSKNCVLKKHKSLYLGEYRNDNNKGTKENISNLYFSSKRNSISLQNMNVKQNINTENLMKTSLSELSLLLNVCKQNSAIKVEGKNLSEKEKKKIRIVQSLYDMKLCMRREDRKESSNYGYKAKEIELIRGKKKYNFFKNKELVLENRNRFSSPLNIFLRNILSRLDFSFMNHSKLFSFPLFGNSISFRGLIALGGDSKEKAKKEREENNVYVSKDNSKENIENDECNNEDNKNNKTNINKVDPCKIFLPTSSGLVDRTFLRKCILLWRLAVPNWFCRESALISSLMIALISRTFLSIWIANINGSVVKSVVRKDFNEFISCLTVLALYSVPACFVNSSIEFLNESLATQFRERMTIYFVKKYFRNLNFYRLINLDCRIHNSDHILTEDLNKWCNALSSLFSNFTKPLFDIILLSTKLSQHVGLLGPVLIVSWYAVSAIILRVVTPAFGKRIAHTQKLEGDYRKAHTAVLNHSEEIAFYRGNEFECAIVLMSFARLIRHIKVTLIRRLYMGCFDSLLVKYGAVLVGYSIIGIPVFGSKKNRRCPITEINDRNLTTMNEISASQITQDYVRNTSLLINLAKAIGRLVTSYKELQSLSGYTHLVCQFHEVLEDLQEGLYAIYNKNSNVIELYTINNNIVNNSETETCNNNDNSVDYIENFNNDNYNTNWKCVNASDLDYNTANNNGNSLDDINMTNLSRITKNSTPSSNFKHYVFSQSSLCSSLENAVSGALPSFSSSTFSVASSELSGDNTLSNNELSTAINNASSSSQDSRLIIVKDYIEFSNVWVMTPGDEVLIKNLSFVVKKGINLFVIGPNGCGKSSLFRILGELWPLKNGCLKKPPLQQIFYIPQKPYMPIGTLREQIIYPDTEDMYREKGRCDEELINLLKKVKLEYLLTRYNKGLDKFNDWEEELSGGEKQRIAMCRLFFHKPMFAILDEATSAMSVDIEGFLYECCKCENISIITVSHKLNLLKYHTHVLKVNSEGEWLVKQINEEYLLRYKLKRFESYSSLLSLTRVQDTE